MTADIAAAYYTHLLANYFRLSPEHRAVCHYTSGSALMSILKSGVLRLTNVRFMNDPQELKHPVEILQDIVRRARFGVVQRSTPAIEHMRDHVIPKLEERSTRQYIFSTSLDSDSTHMWKSYAKDDGYALEFDIPDLVDLFSSLGVALRGDSGFSYKDFSRFNGVVLYDPALQRSLIDYTINYIDRVILQPPLDKGIVNPIGIAERETRITHAFYSALYNMKGPHHLEEHEYRFVLVPDPGYSHVQIRRLGSTEVPYIEAIGMLPAAKQIWIGPGKHNAARMAAIRKLASSLYPNITWRTTAVSLVDGT
jgi:hypothetical protein